MPNLILIFQVMDSSGDAMVNVVEFVSFMITTKQVQIKLRQQGIIDAEGLNDATRIDRKRRRARLCSGKDKDGGDHGPAPANAALQAAKRRAASGLVPHPQMSVLTGAEYSEDGQHGLVEDLATCLLQASHRLVLDPMELERWLALQVTQLSLASFVGASSSSASSAAGGVPSAAADARRRHKPSYRAAGAAAHGRLDARTGEPLEGPHLADFCLRAAPAGGRQAHVGTQTLLKVDGQTQAASGSGPPGQAGSRTSELPLMSQGFAHALWRSRAGQPSHALAGSAHALRPLPALPFAALADPTFAPAPTPPPFPLAGPFGGLPAAPRVVELALGIIDRRERTAVATTQAAAGALGRGAEAEVPRRHADSGGPDDDVRAPLLSGDGDASGGGGGRNGQPAARAFAPAVGKPGSSGSGANWAGPQRRSPSRGLPASYRESL
jgi:hypothetical protein